MAKRSSVKDQPSARGRSSGPAPAAIFHIAHRTIIRGCEKLMGTTSGTAELAPPTPESLLAARRFLQSCHPRTALRELTAAWTPSAAKVYVKCEDETPIRSFKGRGALWLLACLQDSDPGKGVITASTGNHGQGVAFAASRFGIRSVVVVPVGSSPLKIDKIRGLGADLRIIGADLTEASVAAREAAAAEGLIYVEDGEDPALMAGAATVGWEILEDLPEADAIVVPVGGGNLIAGIALVAKRLKPSVRMIGVQSAAAPAVTRSFEAGRVVDVPSATFAGGLATAFPGQLALNVICDLVDDMVLVSETELRAEIRDALASRATLIEGAAAAAFAALRRYGSSWGSACPVLVQTGANVSLGELESALAVPPPESGLGEL
jgi:threonine dehydratase